MQIVLFLPHYQLVYANFDFSLFSLISYRTISVILPREMIQITALFVSFHNTICITLKNEGWDMKECF